MIYTILAVSRTVNAPASLEVKYSPQGRVTQAAAETGKPPSFGIHTQLTEFAFIVAIKIIHILDNILFYVLILNSILY